MGRPIKEIKKDLVLRVRLEQETLTELDACAEHENTTRSEVVRRSIKDRYAKIKK